ncbi:hypothetical protein Tco_1386859 [Tanacetum coccineum]
MAAAVVAADEDDGGDYTVVVVAVEEVVTRWLWGDDVVKVAAVRWEDGDEGDSGVVRRLISDEAKGLIMEYLVNISKRCAFWSLNEDILKITILKTNTPYPSRKIRRIRACTHQRPQRKENLYACKRPNGLMAAKALMGKD